MHCCTTALYSGGRVLSKCMCVDSAAQRRCHPGACCRHLQADYVPGGKAWGVPGTRTCVPEGSAAEVETTSKQQGRASAGLQPSPNLPHQRQSKCEPVPSVSDRVLRYHGKHSGTSTWLQGSRCCRNPTPVGAVKCWSAVLRPAMLNSRLGNPNCGAVCSSAPGPV